MKQSSVILLAAMIVALVFAWRIGERGTGALAQQGGSSSFIILKCVDKLGVEPRTFVVSSLSQSMTAPRISVGASCAQALADLTGNAGLQILNVQRSDPYVGGVGESSQSTGIVYTLGPASALAVAR